MQEKNYAKFTKTTCFNLSIYPSVSIYISLLTFPEQSTAGNTFYFCFSSETGHSVLVFL